MTEIVRHRKTGGLYEALFRGARVRTTIPLGDYAEVIVCRHEPSGEVIVHPASAYPVDDAVLLHSAQIQTGAHLEDGAEVVVYRSVLAPISVWVRPTSEMDDGRFEPVDAGGARPVGLRASLVDRVEAAIRRAAGAYIDEGVGAFDEMDEMCDRAVAAAAQAEVERLTLDLRSAEMDRDDARRGEEIWALRCGVIIGRSPIPDAPADLGRLPAETFWRAARVQDRVRWADRAFDERQRWAYAEAACIEKARGQAPEVQSLVAEVDRLRTALSDSESKRVGLDREVHSFIGCVEALQRHVNPFDVHEGHSQQWFAVHDAIQTRIKPLLASTPSPQETARVED